MLSLRWQPPVEVSRGIAVKQGGSDQIWESSLKKSTWGCKRGRDSSIKEPRARAVYIPDLRKARRCRSSRGDGSCQRRGRTRKELQKPKKEMFSGQKEMIYNVRSRKVRVECKGHWTCRLGLLWSLKTQFFKLNSVEQDPCWGAYKTIESWRLRSLSEGNIFCFLVS